MITTVVDKNTGKEYNVDENGNIINPNKRRFGPADPRVDPRTNRKISLSELSKEKAAAQEVETNKSFKYNNKSFVYDDTPEQSTANQAADEYINTNMGSSDPSSADSSTNASDGYGTAGRINSGLFGLAGLYELNKNKQAMGTGQGYIQGASSGAAIGTALSPGIGTLIGAGLGAGYGSGSRWVSGTGGALAGAQTGYTAGSMLGGGPMSPAGWVTGGIGALLGGVGGGFAGAALGHGVSRTQLEENKRKKLKEEMGIDIPINPESPNGKEWELNPVFAETRNESDLTGTDIINAADWYAMVPGWAELSEEDKIATAQEAINQGAIKEHHGGIDINFADNPAFTAWVEQMMRAQKDPYRKIPYSEAYPMEYAAAQQDRKATLASMAMSFMPSSYASPFSSSSISLDNSYIR